MVVVLQLLGTSCSCYNNNFRTKCVSPALTFYIYTWLFWHCFHTVLYNRISMLFSSFLTQVHCYKLIWIFQTHWVKSISTQSSRVIQNIWFFRLLCLLWSCITRERKGYCKKYFCSEIMQNFWFSIRILHSSHWNFGFSSTTCLHY